MPDVSTEEASKPKPLSFAESVGLWCVCVSIVLCFGGVGVVIGRSFYEAGYEHGSLSVTNEALKRGLGEYVSTDGRHVEFRWNERVEKEPSSERVTY